MRTLRYVFLAMVMVGLAAGVGYAQNITNTLGTNGTFTIKDGSTTFLTLSQSNGYLGLSSSLTLPATTSSTFGVIFKGADRFIHNFTASGTNGQNTFMGVNAGNFVMAGSGNAASYNTGVGYYSLMSLTTGNGNSAFGAAALYLNSIGSGNSAFGVWSLTSNDDGNSNSAFGENSLFYNSSGSYNSAFGMGSLNSNDDGNYNSAFGFQSLVANASGSSNSAFGYQSLYYTTGSGNTASGAMALYHNTTGENNSAFGQSALWKNTTTSSNSAFGRQSLYNNIGFGNSAFGLQSLQSNTEGEFNSALGYLAGSNINTGSNNTCIGSNSTASSATVSNEITLGNNSIATLRCNTTTITALSDARDKKNIRDLNLGLDFLMKVKPRLFNWDRRDWYSNRKPDGSKMQATPTAGFIAQELDEVQTSEQAEWLKLVLKSNPDRLEATPGNLLPVVVKAVQELKKENESLKERVLAQKQEIEMLMELKAKVAMLEQALTRPSPAAGVGLIGQR
jgi:hypothetical protein